MAKSLQEVRPLLIVENLSSGSRPSVVLADDNRLYVVKWQNNRQHRRILINEVVGVQILQLLGVASPDWALLRADHRFVGSNRTSLASPGLHFGSAVAGRGRTMRSSPGVAVENAEQIINIAHFIRVLVFDLWVDNTDGRQAVFVPGRTGGYKALMIDNGFAFGFDGVEWRMRDRFTTKAFPIPPSIYRSKMAETQFHLTIARIKRISDEDLRDIQKTIPIEWFCGDEQLVTQVFDQLRIRKTRLQSLVSQWMELQPHGDRDS